MTCGEAVGREDDGQQLEAQEQQDRKRLLTLKDVGEDEVEEMQVSVFDAETGRAEREVLDDRSGRLSVHLVAVGQSVLEAGQDRVDIVLAHLADVLEQERHGLQATVADVELWRAVLVQDGGDAGERTASLGNDGCTSVQSLGYIAGEFECRGNAPMATVEQTRLCRS